MRRWLRRNSGWVTLRRLQREGWWKAWQRWRMWRRILNTPPVHTRVARPEEPVEIHLLCYRNDYLCALWTLKSFYRFAAVDYPVTIHIQGEAPTRVSRRLRRHFPQARIIRQSEADAIVIPRLTEAGFAHLLRAREANHYTMKLTDFVLLSQARQLLTLDSDILFFRKPGELLEHSRSHLFQRDPESTYLMSAEQARTDFGIELAPCVNVGIMRFDRDSISLARCNEFLTKFAKMEGWLEQTLYALHASERRNVAYLPPTYLISLEAGVPADGLIARHYAGPSRALLTEDGMRGMARSGFLR